MKHSKLLFLLLLLSTCSYNNLRFGERHLLSESNHEQLNPRQTNPDSLGIDQLTPASTANQPEAIELSNTIASNDETYIPPSKAIRTLERFQETHLEDHQTAKNLVADIKKIQQQSTERYERQVTMGIIFLCVGALFVLIALLALFKYETTPTDSSTAEGCLDSFFTMTFFAIMAIFMGIFAIAFLVLGSVFVIVASTKLKQEGAK